jgi:hypothetical protein
MFIGAIVYRWLQSTEKVLEDELSKTENNNRKGDRNFTIYSNDNIDKD